MGGVFGGYGWLPQFPDPRDRHYIPRIARPMLPQSVDMRPDMPPVYNQGNLGSCVGNAIAAAFEWNMRQQKEPEVFTPSRLAIYWGCRVIERTTKFDAGAFIRDGFKVINKRGVAPETDWPYDVAMFKKAPPRKFWSHARKHLAVEYNTVPVNPVALQEALASNDPVVIGFSVFDSFEYMDVVNTGWVRQPDLGIESVLGGHAVLLVGYMTYRGILYFIVRNSWGERWGDNGYCYMPASYIANSMFAADAWVLRTVTKHR